MRRPLRIAAAGGVLLAQTACGGSGAADFDPEILLSTPVPPEHVRGATIFAEHCVACHGESALGTDTGPPLVHPVYRPAHHADAAFDLAVRTGVRAHHWGFGDMAPVPGVSPEQTVAITRYVRWLQETVGIR